MTRYSEDWNQITDVAQRKKVQNRIAQRTYRNKLKRRIAELEQLTEVLNGGETISQQVQDEETSSYQRARPPHVQNTSRGSTPSTVTPRDGDVGNVSMNRGSHGRSQFSEPPRRFHDVGTTPSYTASQPQPRPLPSPNPQMSPAGLLGAFPQSATTAGDLPTLPPVSTPLQPNNMNSILQQNHSIVPSITSYNWALDKDSNTFFHLPDDPTNNPGATSMNALDLNTAISPQPNHLSQPSDGRTTLHLAVEHNRLNIVQLLLARNADIRAQDRWGCTALHVAAMKGHEESTKLLLSYYSSSSYSNDSTSNHVELIDVADAAGYTALHHASENGHASIVEILCLAGTNPRAQNGTGATPLHLAAAGGHEAVVVSLFLAATALSNSSPSPGDTSGSNRHLPSQNTKNNDRGSNSKNSSSGSNGNKKNSRSLSPGRTQNFQQHLNGSTSPASNPEVSTNTSWSPSLIALHGPPASLHDLPNILDSYGATPFHVAAESGLSTRIINILLSAGAAIDLLDTRAGFSPLHYAAQKGHESIVRILVDNGASVGMKATCGWNALHLAVQGGHDAVVAVLLERGAEVDGRTEAGGI